jgi:hypothetical protein
VKIVAGASAQPRRSVAPVLGCGGDARLVYLEVQEVRLRRTGPPTSLRVTAAWYVTVPRSPRW